MVDVPTPEQPLTQMPQSRVTAGDIASVDTLKAQQVREGDISQGLQQLGAGLDALATPIAETAGRQSASRAIVTRNPDGSPTVELPPSPPILGPAGLAFQRAQEAGALARGQNVVARDAADIRVAANGDSAKYLSDMQDYAQRLKVAMPDKLGDAMSAEADRLGTQHYGSMLQQEHAQSVTNAQTAIQAQLDAAKNDALVLARKGGVGPDNTDYQEAVKRVNGYYDQLTGNPLFGMPQEKADLEKKHFADFAQADFLQANIDRTFTRKGRAEAAKELDDQIVNNPDLNLSEQERQHFRQVGLSRLEYLSNLQKADIDAIRPATVAFEEGLRSGKISPDDRVLDMTIDKAKSLGGDATQDVMRLEAARDQAVRSVPFRGLSSTGLVNGAMTGTPAMFDPNNTDRYLDRTKSIENPSGNPRAVSPTGASGDFQFTRGTAAQYGVVDPTDPAQAREGARRLALDNAASLTQTLGRPPTE
ncbi:MAG: hypothetical protein JOZ16_01270, partial [Methylobacteriaceae bacterium]|nr:hypothetical protein [Methylobacteriaceae bacterium]